MSKDEVIRLIREAFAAVGRPARSDFAHCPQCELWLERFLEFCPDDWEEISPSDISYECEALAAATPRAWRFLLPAYMTWHLQHGDTSDASTVDHLIWQLTRSERTDEYIVECYESLSQQQVAAVRAFLRFVATQSADAVLAEDASKALNSYWCV